MSSTSTTTDHLQRGDRTGPGVDLAHRMLTALTTISATTALSLGAPVGCRRAAAEGRR
jgi:hypothetical protein